MPRLARALAIRPGEGRLVAIVALAFAALEAGRGLGESAMDGQVVTAFTNSILPFLAIALGLTGLLVTVGFGTLLALARGATPFVVLPLALAAVIAAERIAVLTGAIPTAVALPIQWVTVFLAGSLLVTLAWTVAGRVFDARQAKRLFPVCTSAAIAGGAAGQLAAGPAAALLGTGNVVLLQSGLIVAMAISIGRLGGRLAPSARAPRTGTLEVLRSGAMYVSRSSLMRLVAVAYLLFAVLGFAIQYPFYGAMQAAFPDEAALTGAIGLLSAGVTAASFLVSTFVANRLYARFGVATVALALPVAYLLGFGVWLVGFGLPTAVAVRVTQQITQRGLSNAAWSAFFSVVPAARRGPVLAFMDGVPGQLGWVLSGAFVLLVSALAMEETQLFVVGALAAAACTVVVVAIRRRYAASLVETLRGGLAEQVLSGGPGLIALTRDPRVVAELCAASEAERPAERRLAAEVLGQVASADALEHLLRLTSDVDGLVRRAAVDSIRLHPGGAGEAAVAAVRPRLDDPLADVRVAAVRTLAAVGRSEDVVTAAADVDVRVRAEVASVLPTDDPRAGTLVATLLADPSADTRAAGLDVLARTTLPLALAAVRAATDDPSPLVRAAGLRVLARSDAPSDADATLQVALDDPDTLARQAAARTLVRRPGGVAVLADVLRDGASMRAQDAALVGLSTLEHPDSPIREALIGWARRQVDRAARYRAHAAALEATVAEPALRVDDPTAPVGADYLGWLLRRRSDGIVRRLLTALAILGATEATGLIRRCLLSPDPETRAQAIEAVDALGDAALAKAVVRLLDSEPDDVGPGARTIPAIAHRLLDDPDPWVRALALRTFAAYLDDTHRALAERARHDPDAVVRTALEPRVASRGEDVPETRATLGDIERMLLLRRVPLFATLEPEDLQRLAATAVERVYAGGEALVTEGDLGDELVAIVDGRVRVVHLEEDGERLLREYGPGDHIGELAVLREGVRAATVIAEEPGVRGLVIGGQAVTSILRERPEAAMAMLATLAERITRQ